jgi:hypothetical protein
MNIIRYRSADINIWYMLKLAAKVQGMFTNFNVDIPIKLGTEPNPDLNLQQIVKPLMVSYSSEPEQSMFTDHDLPPGYDSIMARA